MRIMMTMTTTTRVFYIILTTTTLSHNIAKAVLPPGYEDEMWCPPGYCKRAVNKPNGWVGPVSEMYECYDSKSDVVVEGLWTGSLSKVEAPGHWGVVESEGDCVGEVKKENSDDSPAAVITLKKRYVALLLAAQLLLFVLL